MDTEQRLHSLDALRASALLAGIVLHAAMSFMQGFREVHYPIVDVSTSTTLDVTFYVIHVFRMALFVVIAGFFARVLCEKLGAGGFMRNRGKRVGLVLLALYIPIVALSLAPIIWAAVRSGVQGPGGGQDGANNQGVPWIHLWFLYLLLIFYVMIVGLRALATRIDANGTLRNALGRALRFCFDTRLAPVVLAVPICAAMVGFAKWPAWAGVPVPGAGLIPNLPALVCYGSAVLLGWFMHRDRETLARTARDTWVYLAAAAVLTAVALSLVGVNSRLAPIEFAPNMKIAYAAAYFVAQWCWVLGLIGLVQRFFSAPSPRWRYLADASYWMYLIHVPIVWGLATWMMFWPVSWMVKFPLILAMTSVLLFASYHYLVRPTWLGKFLNGRKYPRGSAGEPVQTKNFA
jgi:glucans biosynthesis protein C